MNGQDELRQRALRDLEFVKDMLKSAEFSTPVRIRAYMNMITADLTELADAIAAEKKGAPDVQS